MKTLKSLTCALFGMTTLAATLTSCQDEDFGFTKEEIRESDYITPRVPLISLFWYRHLARTA